MTLEMQESSGASTEDKGTPSTHCSMSVRSRATTPLRHSSGPASLKFMPATIVFAMMGSPLKPRSAAQGAKNPNRDESKPHGSDEQMFGAKQQVLGEGRATKKSICQ